MALPTVPAAETLRTQHWEEYKGKPRRRPLPETPSRKVCRCLAMCPWIEECSCNKPLRRAASLPGAPVPGPFSPQHEALVADTARSFLPRMAANSALVHRAKTKSQRELLQLSCNSGHLTGLRSGVMSASVVLGTGDPHVKRVQKVLAKAESFRRFCRNTYLELEPRNIRRSMEAVLGQLYVIEHMLGLGPSLWEDPFLSWARAAAWAWQEHQSVFDDAAAQLALGPAAYCESWVLFALSSEEPLFAGFGAALTDELLRLPDAGLELVKAMCRVFSQHPIAPSSGGPGYDAELKQIVRLARLLGGLESQRLEHMLLRQGSSGQTSFELAAQQHDLRAFCVLILLLYGERLTMTADLQVSLSGTITKPGFSPVAHGHSTDRPLSRAGQRLCQVLNLSPEHLDILGLRLVQSGGFHVRLQPLLGSPTAQQALESLQNFGTGAIAEPRKPIQRLDKWQSAIATASLVFDFPARCVAARDASEYATQRLAQCTTDLEQCERHTAELAGLISETTGKRDEAKEKAQAEQTEYMEMMKKELALSKQAMSGDDQAEEELDAHKAAMKTKKADLGNSRAVLADYEQKFEQLSSEYEEASSAKDEARANLEAARADAAEAAATADDTVNNFESVLQTPLAPSH
eukprot:TRINITY_DN27635_c0_g1_i1.p1 TRINITY_DN27635_c0_g1~~TRINITY_DN27635_c0_g1_i1.p1  ORF type:complete len:634 (-),score=128.71 TRINITY_DN27635_c0_g1_i1:100-2001(-)